MSSGGHSGISNGTFGAQGALEQMNSVIQAKANEHTIATKSEAPIRLSKDLRYSKKKTENYLLNKDHSIGGAKAKFFEDVLGYSKTDSKQFHKAVIDSIIGKTPDRTQQTQYGVKHTFHTVLKGKNGQYAQANVVVVIQKDNQRTTYKIITVIPDRKD